MDLLDTFFDESIKDLSAYKEWDENYFINKLKEFDDAYYTEGKEPLVEDSEYDKLYYYAKNKFNNNEYFIDNIGTKIIKGKKYEHKYVIGSLKKFKGDKNSGECIEKWLSKYSNNTKFVITPKFDGLSIYAEYIDGKFSLAATRGDGLIGTDITEKAKLFIPLELQHVDNLYIRGEILLFGDKYKDLNKANRRNAASGIIGTDSNEHAEKLSVIFYEIISTDNYNLSNESERMSYLNFQYPKNNLVYLEKNKDEITTDYLNLLLLCWKEKFEAEFDIDGLVITVSDSEREDIKLPSNKVAFKNTDEWKIGVVKQIKWETSRSGRVCPVIELEESLMLSGASVTRATAYNAAFIRDNKISIGTKLKIQRSGDVIPKIIEIIN